MQRIEDKIVRIIKGEAKGRKADAVRTVLLTLSKLYGAVVGFRLWMYRHRFFRKIILGCPVISVGNITVGGTGKTPVVEMLARSLSQGGRKVAVLSRGYKKKRKFFRKNPLSNDIAIVSDGKVIRMNAQEAGDEPYMLARNLDGVCVLVAKNRIRSGSFAIKNLGVDILLLDDGFQYLPIHKTHEILLIDSTNPFGYGYVLPRGLLRESSQELSRANFVFLTKVEKVSDTTALKEEIRHISPTSEILECIHDPKYLTRFDTEEKIPLSFLASRKICALSAIAIPEGFEDTLIRLGSQIDLSFRFRDHHRYSRRELREVLTRAREKGIDTVITTEKDAVRIPAVHFEGVKILFLRVEIKIVKGASDFNHFVHDICYY
ncbi:MAG: tetraacyldisaccharide 4'-kinase [Chlamydiae bacterium]|nr:tetraacyldisaccharide 4'-kinase [Chlamydiota bacterium]MBI3277867.1 tetraacyldisaccharide 4'-kinase [Chlamydiota bacterium]